MPRAFRPSIGLRDKITRFGLASGRWAMGRHRGWHTAGRRAWMREDELLAYDVVCGPLVRVLPWTSLLAAAGVVA